ncbi:hypothetical protein D5086_015898 [Populus alba]|uniref:Uncharacterized protein n=1 Tax=Populus alba TaxID=43335 RepID=A0ACC4BTR1_POPAL
MIQLEIRCKSVLTEEICICSDDSLFMAGNFSYLAFQFLINFLGSAKMFPMNEECFRVLDDFLLLHIMLHIRFGQQQGKKMKRQGVVPNKDMGNDVSCSIKIEFLAAEMLKEMVYRMGEGILCLYGMANYI